MEHQNQEAFLTLSPYNYERFAEADNLLRSGTHIQNHKSQRKVYEFIEDNISSLKIFYEKLYRAKLNEQPTVNNKYYYLDAADTPNKIVSKIKLDQQTTLFAIFLYWLHKVEKQFSYHLTKSELIDALNSNHRIKEPIQKLFFEREIENTQSVQRTLENWVGSSLKQLVKLGWVYFPEDEEKFEVLSAFQRIEIIYHPLIYNIDSIKATYEY